MCAYGCLRSWELLGLASHLEDSTALISREALGLAAFGLVFALWVGRLFKWNFVVPIVGLISNCHEVFDLTQKRAR
jgi:hypothetical protein